MQPILLFLTHYVVDCVAEQFNVLLIHLTDSASLSPSTAFKK